MNQKKKEHESAIVWQEIAAAKGRLGQIAIEKIELEMEEKRIMVRLENLQSGLSLMEAS